MNSQKFVLYACCIPVKGALRSTICDLQRQMYFLIPNGLYEILVDLKSSTLFSIKETYHKRYANIIDEYFEFLIEHELGFWCEDEEADLFTSIDLNWDRPEIITNAIIDVDDQSSHNFQSIFAQLDELACKALQIRYFTFTTKEQLQLVLEQCSRSRLRYIDLIIKYNPSVSDTDIEELCSSYKRVLQITIHSSPYNETKQLDDSNTIVVYNKQAVNSADHCGQINPNYFSTNLEVFTESQQFNTCLNRKISVSSNGDIKNCPSLKESYGNIKENSLFDAVINKNFKSVWYIHKDQIDVCKSCEFRHICTDCRAFLNHLYEKPHKCNYDPFSATWQ